MEREHKEFNSVRWPGTRDGLFVVDEEGNRWGRISAYHSSNRDDISTGGREHHEGGSRYVILDPDDKYEVKKGRTPCGNDWRVEVYSTIAIIDNQPLIETLDFEL